MQRKLEYFAYDLHSTHDSSVSPGRCVEIKRSPSTYEEANAGQWLYGSNIKLVTSDRPPPGESDHRWTIRLNVSERADAAFFW